LSTIYRVSVKSGYSAQLPSPQVQEWSQQALTRYHGEQWLSPSQCQPLHINRASVKYEAWNQSGRVWIPQATPSQTETHSKIVGHKTRKGGSPNPSKLNLPSSAASRKNVTSLSDDKTGQKAHNHRKKCSYPREQPSPKLQICPAPTPPPCKVDTIQACCLM